MFRIFPTIPLACFVNPLAFGLYRIVFWCLIRYSEVMFIITSLRKCFSLSLISSNKCPNYIIISSKRIEAAAKASFFTMALASTLNSIIYSQNDVSLLLGANWIDRPDKVNIPFFKWSKGYDRSKWPMILEGQSSCPMALITSSNISLDIPNQI